ncbi:riboflavin kinase [Aspergillus pseudoviridinutans]|uniref:Riboflavin kinase n=1 Tax=Aspergillus pseudoviridinutans TaxID=1517512 RepID=A0A9P3B4I1_9EURO|nr:riboflavin kinase [Aspergillus pseudoviridinutans]GIJ82560.1 riboflavin kinase [Aspergillus pseudoviridinutans]
MRPDGPRDPVAGPDSGPEPPYPVRLSGPVIKGFGRGSKELGIPTANIPAEGLADCPDLQIGVYYGVVALDPAKFQYQEGEGSSTAGADARTTILPAVLSIGYNPFFKNKTKSVEVHVMPPLSSPSPTAEGAGAAGQVKFNTLPDFYGTQLKLLILGYIRPEYDYVSLEALIEDIRVDCEVARKSLQRPAYQCYIDEDEKECSDAVREQRRWLVTF